MSDDTLKWKDIESYNYIVKSAYKNLQDIIHGEQYEIFSKFWEVKALFST